MPVLESTRSNPLLLLLALAAAGLSCGQPANSGGASAELETGVASGAALTEPAQPPVEDILLITVSSLRADALGFMGNTRASTPVLDQLASRGVVFERAYAHSLAGLPSHASILSGQYPYAHGVRGAQASLPEGVETVATRLRAAGWATGAVVAAPLLDSRFGLASGFESYDDAILPPAGGGAERAERPAAQVARLGLDWWRRQGERPRFLWLHFHEPHAPHVAARATAGRLAADAYPAEVSVVDASLRRIVGALTESAERPALIVFTGDHGEALGDHGELGYGLFAYESTLRVPLLVWGSRLEPRREAGVGRHIDLAPTILEAAGLESGPELAGRSLLANGAAAEPAGSYFEALGPALTRGWAPLRGCVAGRLKWIDLPLPELYDLESDPGERTNLYSSSGSLAAEMAGCVPEASAVPPSAGAFTEADDPKRLVHLDRKLWEAEEMAWRSRRFEALRLLREVIGERPATRSAHVRRVALLLEQGQLEEAIQAAEEARSLGVAGPALERQLGLALFRAERYAESIEVLEPAATEADVEVLSALGAALAELGRMDEARGRLEAATALAPGSARPAVELALVALEQGDWEAARQYSQKALERNPALGKAWRCLGAALYQLGEMESSLAALRNSVDYEPGDFEGLYRLATVAMELGEVEVARSALRRFTGSAPAERFSRELAQAEAWLRRLGG